MELTIALEQPDKKLALFGASDRHLRMIRDTFAVRTINRDHELKIIGDTQSVNQAALVFEHLQRKLRRQEWISLDEVGSAIARVIEQSQVSTNGAIDIYARGRSIVPKTEGQRAYIEAIFEHDLTFCTGPAGTGKTYLAVAVAASMLKKGTIKRIVLVRPAVEAGERLGFLPGDLQAKVNPYLRPLFDALHDMMDFEQVKRFMVNDVIEVIPLAFMRGRTLNDSAVILDEAQNTTVSQMLMFLTRLGHNSKMIVTGDSSQIDLPDGTISGLVDAMRKLRGIKQIATIELDKADIVRHRLVQHIVNAYEQASAAGDTGATPGVTSVRRRRGDPSASATVPETRRRLQPTGQASGSVG